MSAIKLYNPITCYEKNIYNRILKFYNFVVETEQNVEWNDFYIWLSDNKEKATSLSSSFLTKEMDKRAGTKSIDQTIAVYMIAFRDWSIKINDEGTTKDIGQRRRLVWEPEQRQRQYENSKVKAQQVNDLLPMIPLVLDYCVNQHDFKQQLIDIDNSERTAYPSLSEATRKEIHTLTRKTDSELHRILLNSAAYLSVMVATGSRPTELAKVKMKDVTWEDEKVLIRRITAKDGKKRGSIKSIYCAVVPNKVLKHCTVVHLSRHLSQQELLDDEDYVFAYGFSKKANQSEVSFFTMITRRLTAMIEAVFIIQNGVGIGGGNGGKKLHIFRSICTRLLSDRGHGSAGIECHIGWSSSTMQQHYQDQRSASLHRTTLYTLGGRTHKEDNADLAWKFFNDTDENRAWYHRVVQMAVAGGVKLAAVDADESLKSKIEAYRGKVQRGEVHSNETAREKALKRKLREMEQENEQLKKQKVAVQEHDDQTVDVEEQVGRVIGHAEKAVQTARF